MLNRATLWARRLGALLLALVVLVLAVVYGGSEWMIRRSHAAPLVALTVPHDTASVAEGGRLAKVFACRDCHSANGQGRMLFEAPGVGRLIAPAFARVAPRYSDAELIRLIRHGVRRDGSAVVIMPSPGYVQMADEDVVKIVAWMRTLKPSASDETRALSFGPVGRALLLAGKLPQTAVPGDVTSPAKRPADSGRYYVDAMCLSCHRLHEAHQMDDAPLVAPPLATMAAAYDREAFRRLIRTGQPLGKRKLQLMGDIARDGFSAMSDAEIDAVHEHLKREAEKMP